MIAMGVAKPPVWFLDTSSLVSMAVDPGLQSTVQEELMPQKCVLLDVVQDELETLARGRGVAKRLSEMALTQLAWLGSQVPTESLVQQLEVSQIQESVRGARPLRHVREHWAEAVAIDIGSRLTSSRAFLLSEDYNARVEAKKREVEPLSLHKLLSQMVIRHQLEALDAERYAKALHQVERGPECSAHEFAAGALGRVGRP